MKDLFAYVGLAQRAKSLPSVLFKASVTLDGTNSKDTRNTLWVQPSRDFQTTLRLAFTLDAYKALEDLFADALPGLTLPKVSVVCRKNFVQGETATGTNPVVSGSIVFWINDGSVQAKNGPKATFDAAVDFGSSLTSFTFLFRGDTLTGVLAWLGELICQDLSSTVKDLLQKDSIFGEWSLRRVKLTLKINSQNKWSLFSFGIDVEVKAKFGSDTGSVVTFLLSYFYSKTVGSLGTLTGKFWPGMVFYFLPFIVKPLL